MTGRKMVFLVFVCLALFFVGCGLRKPTVPSWDIQFTVPLLNKSYPLIHLIGSNNIGADTDDSSMYLYANGLVGGADIGEGDLKVSHNPEGNHGISLVPIFADSLSLVANFTLEDAVVSWGLVSSGVIYIGLTDVPSVVNHIDILFREVCDFVDGSYHSITRRISPIDGVFPAVTPIDLKGLFITDPVSERLIEDLYFDVTLDTSDDVPYGGYMSIFYDESIIFSSMHGTLNHLRVEAEDYTTTIELNYPENIEDALNIHDPSMSFSIYNHQGFDTMFYATVTASNSRNGTSRTIDVSGLLAASTAMGDSVLTTLTFGVEDGLDVLMNIAPDRLALSDAYFVLVNPEGLFGFASVGKALGGDYVTVVKFDFTFNAGVVVKAHEIAEVPISDKNRDDIRKYARDVLVTMNIRNFVSVGATVNIFLCSSDDADLMYVPQNEFSPGFSRLVLLDNYLPRGSHLVSSDESFVFDIEENDLSIFYDYETIYVGFTFEFDDGSTRIHTSERIDVLGNVRVDILIDF